MKIENYAETNQNCSPRPWHLAEFTIYDPEKGRRVHKYRVYRSKNGGFYFTPPMYFLPNPDDPDGKKLKYPYEEYTPEKAKDFTAKVMELLKEYVR